MEKFYIIHGMNTKTRIVFTYQSQKLESEAILKTNKLEKIQQYK